MSVCADVGGGDVGFARMFDACLTLQEPQSWLSPLCAEAKENMPRHTWECSECKAGVFTTVPFLVCNVD